MASLAEMTSVGPAPLDSTEDILLIVDCSSEMGEMWGDSDGPTRLSVIKQNLRCFVRHKLSFNSEHRFGVCSLTDSASLVLEFTNDSDLLEGVIDALQMAPSGKSFEFGYLLASLEEWVGPRFRNSAPAMPEPAAIVRCLLVYGRSYELPTLCTKPGHSLLEHPHVFLDVLYVHKKITKGNPEKLACQVRLRCTVQVARFCSHSTAINQTGNVRLLHGHTGQRLRDQN